MRNNMASWKDKLIDEVLCFDRESYSEIEPTEKIKMREGLCYCIDRLPERYKEVFYQRYRDGALVEEIQRSIGSVAVNLTILEGIKYLRSAENLSVITLGVVDGVARNDRIKESIRQKLNKKLYAFSEEELAYLDIRRSKLSARERNKLLRAGLYYFYEYLSLENTQELPGIGSGSIKTIDSYIKDEFGII